MLGDGEPRRIKREPGGREQLGHRGRPCDRAARETNARTLGEGAVIEQPSLAQLQSQRATAAQIALRVIGDSVRFLGATTGIGFGTLGVNPGISSDAVLGELMEEVWDLSHSSSNP